MHYTNHLLSLLLGLQQFQKLFEIYTKGELKINLPNIWNDVFKHDLSSLIFKYI